MLFLLAFLQMPPFKKEFYKKQIFLEKRITTAGKFVLIFPLFILSVHSVLSGDQKTTALKRGECADLFQQPDQTLPLLKQSGLHPNPPFPLKNF